MKKNIIILSATLISLSLFVIRFKNKDNTTSNKLKSLNSKPHKIIEGPNYYNIPKLYYGVDTRFAAIKKSDIDKATTIYSFLNEGEKEQIAHINSVDIIVIENNQQSNKREYGSNEYLTDAQLKLIKSLNYFNHFTIRTEFKEKNKKTGKLEDRFFGPHITVVPETQATYIDGKDALITYLKDRSRNNMNIIKENKLGALKLSFTITKQGTIIDVKHDAMTTGYPSIDKKLLELIKNMPGKWIPAKNSKGELIEQEFVFTFGPADGC